MGWFQPLKVNDELIKDNNENDKKKNRRGTFVVAQGEVWVASNRRIQGEIEAVSAHRFVFVHGANGLDDLRTSRTQTLT